MRKVNSNFRFQISSPPTPKGGVITDCKLKIANYLFPLQGLGGFLFFFFFFNSAFAQFTISGKITDPTSGESLVGANVYLENTLKATATDFEGNFRLDKLKAGEYTLKVSYIGYENFSQIIQLTDNQVIDLQLKANNFVADEVIVQSTRVNEKSAFAFSDLDKKEIAKQNLGQDLPILLNFTPSVVTTSDAGAGVGYTGIRIRGSDPTRINVTINGIPLNDAESQGVFWVNMPDFASSVNSIQIQRGVGTSTNGAGAFGASLNLQTNELNQNAYAQVDNSYGSFNTWKHTIRVGSGLLKGKFALDGRISKISSDGFIDRSSSNLKSFYLSGGYYGKKSIVKLNVFSGTEKTYQAWNGVPEARLRGDVAGMQAYIDRNYLDNQDAQNLLNSKSRTYNSFTYDDQTDNYQQDHYQFFYTYEFNPHWNLNVALHYTKGKGYYEEYKKGESLKKYGIEPQVVGNQTIENSDLIRRRWLDNDFYGAVYSLNYTGNRWQFNFGGGINQYQGKHFGEITWARFASNSEIRYRYYDNDAKKTDFNMYAKAFYQISRKFNVFADLQYRQVNYSFLGLALDSFGSRDVQQTANLPFFNPKLGLNLQISNNSSWYASFGVGHKEPNRDDYTQSTAESRPQAEKLLNLETGYRQNGRNWAFSANYYWMNYQNQLVLTGKVNDVGNYTRTNVANSYRMGLELEFKWKILNALNWGINATFSQNKVKNFQEFVDKYDADFNPEEQAVNQFSKTDIAFSPNVILGSQLEYTPFKNFNLALLSKYVGKQYMDNTSSEDRKLNAYFTNDLRLTYQIQPKFIEQINLSLLVNNLFNYKYESNGYTYGYVAGNQRIIENFYYPQAGTNFLVAVGLRF